MTNTRRKLPSWLSAGAAPEKKPEADPGPDMDVKVREDTNGADVLHPQQGGDSSLVEAQADDDGTDEELRRRSSSLKRRSLDAKETKKAKVDEGKQFRPSKLSEGKELDREGKGNASRDEDQGLGGVKHGSEREVSSLLEGVVFTISGIQNPERGKLRSKGLEMGAQYRPDWSTGCTLLVCAYVDTPKFKQVQADGGSIVSKDWILECYKERKLVDFERFVLNKGRLWRLPVKALNWKVNCGSEEEIRRWAQEDLTSVIEWLQQQDAKPKTEELEFTAVQGVLVCLEDTVKSLVENRGLKSIIEGWGFLPRPVKELAAIEESEGSNFSSKSYVQEAERFKNIYDESLKEFLSISKAADHEKARGNDEDEVDDDATEVMTDVRSEETVDYDSDETTVMDPETTQECTRKLIERFTSTVM